MKLYLQKVTLILLVLFSFSVNSFSQLNGGTVSAASICATRNLPASQITNLTLPTGGTAPYSFQWEAKIQYSSWTNVINVGTSPSLSPGNLSYTTSYRRKVTDANGLTAYSNEVKLFIVDEFNAGRAYVLGDSVILFGDPIPAIGSNAANDGTESYAYSWEVSTVGYSGPWTSLPGINTLVIQPQPYTIPQARYYRKKTTDLNCGTFVYAVPVKLEVVSVLPFSATHWTSSTMCFFPNNLPKLLEGNPARGGQGPYTYQWEKRNFGSISWELIAGANNANYQPPLLSVSTYFRRRATDVNGATGYSNADLLTLANTLPNPGSITSTGTLIAPNAPLNAAIEITSASNFNQGVYAWQSSTNNGANWTEIANAGYNNYYPETPPTITTCYRRSIREFCATPFRDTWTNTVCISPAMPLTAGAISLGSGNGSCITPSTSPGIITGTPATGGATPYIYKWQKFDGIDFIDISSSNVVSYTPGLLNQSTKFRRIVTDGNGTSLTSNEVSVTISSSTSLKGGIIDGPIITCSNTAPGILSNIIDVCGGGGTYTYSWESNTGSGWNLIGGANQATHNATSIAGDTKFRRKVGDGCGNVVYSNEVPVYVYPAIEAGTISPATQNVCYNQVPELLGLTQNCHYTNGNVTYQWQRSASAAGSFTNISGATQPVYLPKTSNISSYYRLVVTSSVCNAQAISNVSAVIVNTGCFFAGRTSGGINTNDNALASNLSGRGNMKLYPNPVQKGQVVFINFDGDGANCKATLRGTDGRTYACTISAAARGALQVKMPVNVAQGTYLIQLSNGQKQWVERIVIF